MAKRGTVDAAWLTQMLTHSYFQRQPPKTTGRELFGTHFALECVTDGQARGLSTHDIIATLTALTAHSIANAYTDFAPAPIEEVILAGGGQHNQTLVNMIRARLDDHVLVVRHDEIGISSDHKEALLFAVLGYETWHNRVGSLPEQTGARHPVVLGQITPADNYVQLLRETWGQR
jgi:anhydro-N-acetylmuramic acid kinase